MKKYKHLKLEDRLIIEALIKLRKTCKEMSIELNRSESTIRREVKKNRYQTQPSLFNNDSPRTCSCSLSFPYVCNNCTKHNRQKVYKYFYSAERAQKAYHSNISFSRVGTNIDNEIMKEVDEAIVDGLTKNQSVNHIIHANHLPISLSTAYRWINDGVLSSKAIDLQKAVRYKNRKPKSNRGINKANRQGRTYVDYLSYISDNPHLNMVEMDTIEGLITDSNCLLTFVCIKSSLFFSFLLDAQTSANVVQTLNELEMILGNELFRNLFGVILTDNGSEFSDANAIEFSPFTGERRTRLYYCDPNRSDQKGTIERKHVDVRFIIPKKKSIVHLTKQKVDLINSHVNAILRPTLNNQSTFSFAEFMHGSLLLELLCITFIEPTSVHLKPELVK